MQWLEPGFNQSLVGELKSHKLCRVTKKNDNTIKVLSVVKGKLWHVIV